MGGCPISRRIARYPSGPLDGPIHPRRSQGSPRGDHGPVDRKMVINALNSGAQVYMADFEDPRAHVAQHLEGQINLRDAVRGDISYTSPDGKRYTLAPQTATLMVPRGWHLAKHVCGRPRWPVVIRLRPFLLSQRAGVAGARQRSVFLSAKLESSSQARCGTTSSTRPGRPRHSPRHIGRTVLIETILAAFEMDEILYELRGTLGSLKLRRWDTSSGAIKSSPSGRLRAARPGARDHGLSLPQVYVDLLVRTGHHAGVHCEWVAWRRRSHQTRRRRERRGGWQGAARQVSEVYAGHDGTWVAHPGLVAVGARGVRRGLAPPPNRAAAARRRCRRRDLLALPDGAISSAGLGPTSTWACNTCGWLGVRLRAASTT